MAGKGVAVEMLSDARIEHRGEKRLTLSELRRHVRDVIDSRKPNTRTFKCPVCPKTLNVKGPRACVIHLLCHLAGAYGDYLPFKCPADGCIYTSGTRAEAVRHVKKLHPEELDRPPICQYEWSFYSDLNDMRIYEPYVPPTGDPSREDILRLLEEAVALGDKQSCRRAFNGNIEWWHFDETQRVVLMQLKDLATSADDKTLRAIFYDTKLDLMGVPVSVSAANYALRSICTKLGILRHHFGVIANTKGLCYGNLQLRLGTGEVIAFDQRPVPIRDEFSLDSDVIIETLNADDGSAVRPFILCVEHHVAFEKIRTSFREHFPNGILVTSSGNPSYAASRLCKLFGERTRHPVYLMTDCDPYGLRIALVMKYGSLKRVSVGASGDVTVPGAIWIGPRSMDIRRPETHNKLTADAEEKLAKVRSRAAANGEDLMVAEADLMLRTRRTYPLQKLTKEEMILTIHNHLANAILSESTDFVRDRLDAVGGQLSTPEGLYSAARISAIRTFADALSQDERVESSGFGALMSEAEIALFLGCVVSNAGPTFAVVHPAVFTVLQSASSQFDHTFAASNCFGYSPQVQTLLIPLRSDSHWALAIFSKNADAQGGRLTHYDPLRPRHLTASEEVVASLLIRELTGVDPYLIDVLRPSPASYDLQKDASESGTQICYYAAQVVDGGIKRRPEFSLGVIQEHVTETLRAVLTQQPFYYAPLFRSRKCSSSSSASSSINLPPFGKSARDGLLADAANGPFMTPEASVPRISTGSLPGTSGLSTPAGSSTKTYPTTAKRPDVVAPPADVPTLKKALSRPKRKGAWIGNSKIAEHACQQNEDSDVDEPRPAKRTSDPDYCPADDEWKFTTENP